MAKKKKWTAGEVVEIVESLDENEVGLFKLFYANSPASKPPVGDDTSLNRIFSDMLADKFDRNGKGTMALRDAVVERLLDEGNLTEGQIRKHPEVKELCGGVDMRKGQFVGVKRRWKGKKRQIKK